MPKIDLTNLNKIDTDLVLPSTSDNLTMQYAQENKWGSLLNNQTFKTINNNIKFLKNNLIEIINTVNNDLDCEVANFNTFKIKNTELIKKDNNSIILGSDNNITVLKGTDLYFNNDKIEFNKFVKTDELTNYAKLNNINNFTQKIKGTDIESNKLITNELTLNGVNVNLSNYSTKEDTIKQIEKVMGLTYGGNIQDVSNKIKGKFYYDETTKFYYECIEDNSLTYIDNLKFKKISNKPISDKIENLPKLYTKTSNINFLNGKFVIKIPKLNFIFGILEVARKTYGWANKIIFTEGESCFEHIYSLSNQKLVITTDSQNVYLSSQDNNVSLFQINSITFFYYD